MVRYRCFSKKQKGDGEGGAYWHDADFEQHLLLTQYQTSYNYLLKKFPPPLCALEAGCGIGRWIIPMAQKGYEITGIEIEQEALNIIETHYKATNLKLVNGDILNMPFQDDSFDLVISLGVLEHFEKPEIQNKAISEHIRVMKSDGFFFVTVPHVSILRLLIHFPYTLLLSLVRKAKGKKEFFTEYRYSARAFRRILEKNKLEIVEEIWDDLLPPYSFGLTVDYPLKRFTLSKDKIQYKMNKSSVFLQRVLWGIYPGIISGGVGYICKKSN